MKLMGKKLEQPDEYENLKSDKGNPMFIDGTAVPNRLNWELTMITLVDQYLGIQPGGSMFSINSNKEIFDWFLEQILDLFKDKYQITMITDEDLSLSSSIDSYNLANEEKTQINHVLCSWHKTRNFEKKLNECKLDESTKERIRFCWKRICYSPKKDIVLSCIDEIKQLKIQALTYYIDNHVVPILNKFSRAFIPCFTAGYNVTSLSESANSMLKRNLTSAYYTLFEIKEIIRRAYYNKNIVQHEKLIAKQRGGSFLDETFGIVVHSKVEEILISSLLKAFRLNKVDDNCYFDPRFPDEKFEINYPDCECQKVRYSGLPCSHIMRWSLDHKLNPMLQVSKRYLEYAPSFTEITDFSKKKENFWREVISSKYKQMRIQLKESQTDLIDSFSKAIPREKILPNLPEKDKTQTIRYNEILSYAKDLAKHASKSENETQNSIHQLKMMKNAITKGSDHDPNEESEVFEAKTKKKGRPKKTRIRPSFENSSKRKCPVCTKLGYESDHMAGLCKYYQRLIEIGQEMNQAFTDQELKKCSLCKCKGHNCKKCHALKALKDEITEQMQHYQDDKLTSENE